MPDDLQEVHAGRADEAATKRFAGRAKHRVGIGDLLDLAVLHDDDAVGHRHGLDLIVGDVDRRDAEPLVQRADLGPGVDAQLGVEIGERLVHQEGLRLAHDRAPERHALPLAAGQGPRAAVEQMVDAEDLGGLADAPLDLGGRLPRILRPKPMFLRTREMRVERVVLEDHGDVAVARREIGDVAPADEDLARRGRLQPGEDLEHRRLAAAGRADEHDELAVGDVEGEILEDGEAAVGLA